MVQLDGVLVGLGRQLAGIGAIRIAKESGSAAGLGKRRRDQTARLTDARGRNNVAGERRAGAVSQSGERIVNRADGPIGHGPRIREVADALSQRRNGGSAGIRLRITIAFKNRPEERLILAVVNLRNPNLAAEATHIISEWLVGARGAGAV